MASGGPGGAPYDWFQRGRRLLAEGHPAAAVTLLRRAADAEPAARSVREVLARALFDSGDFAAARDAFGEIIAADPVDDYARFGRGMSCRRLGDLGAAVEEFALAVAMRPANADYAQALRETRATLVARR